MVNINTASLITSGLLTGGSLIVGHLLRSLTFLKGRSFEDVETLLLKGGIKKTEKKKFNEEETEKREKRYFDSQNNSYDAKNIFNYFRLVYKNDTGERIGKMILI